MSIKGFDRALDKTKHNSNMTELEFTLINTGEKAGKGTKQSGNEKDIFFL